MQTFLDGRGLRSELREPDNVRQADGHRAELLRRRHLALLQLERKNLNFGFFLHLPQ